MFRDDKHTFYTTKSFESVSYDNHSNNFGAKKIIPVTIDQFFDEYIEFINDPDEFSPSYQRSINLTLRHFKGFFGDKRILSTIQERDYEKLFRSLKQHAPGGHKVYYRDLKAALTRAQKWNYVGINYLKSDDFRKRYRPDKKKPIFINQEDLLKILDAMADPILKRITMFGYYTGCRVSEITNLKWSNIDFSQNLIRIGDFEFTTKDKEDRIIPFGETLKDILNKQKNVSNMKSQHFVFLNQNGSKFRTDNISKRFKKAVRKAEVNPYFTFHKLRASFISNLANNGVNIAVIQQLSGHNSLQAITPYLSYEQRHLRDAVLKLDNL